MPLQQTTDNNFTFIQISLYCYSIIRQNCPLQTTVVFGWILFDVKENT